jgi:hypothetical protein
LNLLNIWLLVAVPHGVLRKQVISLVAVEQDKSIAEQFLWQLV